MKIFLLHGDNITLSYTRLMKYVEHAKKRNWDITHYKDKSQKLELLMVTDSLFGNDKLVIVDDFALLTKKDLEWLTKNGEVFHGNLVIYNDAVLTPARIKTIPSLEKVEEFTYPVLLWKLLEQFYPGNSKQFLDTLHTVLQKEPVELIFGLLAKHVRDMYWVLVAETDYPYPSWKASKIKAQAKKFTKEQIESIIENLSEIDTETKTTDQEMGNLLDLLVVRDLQ